MLMQLCMLLVLKLTVSAEESELRHQAAATKADQRDKDEPPEKRPKSASDVITPSRSVFGGHPADRHSLCNQENHHWQD